MVYFTFSLKRPSDRNISLSVSLLAFTNCRCEFEY